MISRIAILLLSALLLSACSKTIEPAVPDPAPHGELIYSQYRSTPGYGPVVVRSSSDGSGHREIARGILTGPPHAGRILFWSRDTLYSATLEGDSVRVLMTNIGSDVGFGPTTCISPDGAHLLRVDREIGGEMVLRVANIDGSKLIIVARALGSGSGASYSPDGSRIAYIGADLRLYTVRPTSKDQLALTPRVSGAGGGSEFYGSTPQWSPDGRWIAIESFTSDSIEVIQADGGSPVPDMLFRGAFPEWSPDGREIICADLHWNDADWIVTHPINGTARGVMQTRQYNHLRFPRWSKDGRRAIALFVEDDLGSYLGDLKSIDIATGTPTQIATMVHNAYWLP